MNICVYGSATDRIDPKYIKAGETLGAALAKHGHTVVFGGGGGGMMGAVARGVRSADGKLIGIAPSFFIGPEGIRVDGKLFDGCTEFHFTDTMRERKQMLEDLSDAFIVTPGGIGTYDEFFEILCLKQLDRHNKPVLLYNVSGYYDHLIKMLEKTAEENFMKSKALELFVKSDDPETAIKYLETYSPADDEKVESFR